MPSRSWSPYACDICGEPMRFREINGHQRAAHAEILVKRGVAMSRLTKRLLWIFAPSSVLMVLAMFLPLNVFGVHAPGPYFVAVFAAWVGSVFLAWLYAWRSTKTDFDFFGSVPYLCHVCGDKIRRHEMKTHLQALHPDEFRYLRMSLYAVLGSLLGWIAGVGVLVLLGVTGVILFPNGDFLGTVFLGGLLVWMAAVILYGVFRWPRHVDRVRSRWGGLGRAR